MKIETGDELTIANDIIDISGNIIFSAGDKVIVAEVWKDDAKYSSIYDMWMPEKIYGVKLVGQYGWWLLHSFIETTK